ncbi:MAG TPA: hypothetical protein PLX88_09670 [Syntrophorhabdaceae bacterium]|nr:hypothetical protein [Syntrophorhabdaceae bacterium]
MILKTAFLRGFSAHNLRKKMGDVDPDVLEQAANEAGRKSRKRLEDRF